MKLSEAMQVNEIKNEYITLVDTNGNPLKIDKADLIEVIRANMPTVTSQAKGLMPTDGFFSKTPLSKEDNVDELLTTGIYPHGFRIVTSITSSSYGILLVFKTSYPLAELNKRIFKSANRFVVNVVYILKDCKCTYFP